MGVTGGERVLILGASGYVGTHLVPRLAARGCLVRAAARRRGALEARGWTGVEIVEADALDPASLDAALRDIDTAYYLVHSMGSGRDFPRLDRLAAANFRDAAARAGLRRIVYLGGLQPPGASSAHLKSRGETGDILRAGSVPVTEIRAGVIIGPGSAAFEVIRDLVFHLPWMVTPRWVRSRSQPIALPDVLAYLERVAELPAAAGRIFDVGGPEILSYEDLMRGFGELVGRHPRIVPVPLLTPKLSSYWLDLVTAVPTSVARALIEGLGHDVLADDAPIRSLVPLALTPYREAARQALDAERTAPSQARWSEGSWFHRNARADFAFYAKRFSGAAVAAAPAAAAWSVVTAVGGANGYYYLDALWRLRGWLDEWVGGPGLARGRRDPNDVALGDAIDFWRVVAIEPRRRMTLQAEMKLPGSATLEFELLAEGAERTRVEVTGYFHPAGVLGLLYWHALAPAHVVLFGGFARAIAKRAEASIRTGESPPPGH